MLQSHFQQGIYMFIRQGIVHGLSLPPVLDQCRIPEDAQLVGYSRLFHNQFIRQITDTALSTHQCLKDAQTRRIAQDFKNARQRHDIFLWHRSLLRYFLFCHDFSPLSRLAYDCHILLNILLYHIRMISTAFSRKVF